MKKITKVMRQTLSLLLVLCLLVSLCPAVFAEQTQTQAKKYVSLGDSMTNGYGLTGYGNVNGYLEESPDAYPAKLADYFGWDLTQLAMSAMRAEDLHYILEYGRENAYQGDDYTRSEFINGRFKNDCGGVEAAAETYQSAVADADVITMGVGNANFGVFLLGRITNALGVLGGNPAADAWIDFEDAIRECDEPTKAFLRQIRAEVAAKLYEIVPADAHEIVAPIENAISYAVVSYMMNYAGCVDRIVELNPDVEIIIVGIMNTFTGMDLSYEGQVIPLGDVVSEAVEAINIYLSTQPVVLQMLDKFPEAKFYYAESPDVDIIVNTFPDQIANSDTVLRDRVLQEVQSMIWPMLNAGAPGTYAYISRSDVEAYEAAYEATLKGNVKPYAEFLANNQPKLMAITVYLAFEKAIVEASQLEALDANALIKLASGLGDVFDGMEAKVEAHISNNIDSIKMATAISIALYMRGSMEVADIYKFLALPDGMSYVLMEDDTIMSLLNLFARMLIGNGIGCHPSAVGHDSLTQAIIESYENGYTASDAASEKINVAINKILYALEKYGPQDTNHYEVNTESYYVALGDSSVFGYECVDYAEQFAKENRLDYKNLAQKGLLIQNAGAVIQTNAADIAKADLITVGFSNTTLLQEAFNASFNQTEYDWEALVTAQGAQYVESMLAEIKKELVAAGIGGIYTIGFIQVDITEFVVSMIENYAYNSLVYAYTMPEYVNAVRAINPDAKIVIVGMYNPLKDVTLELSADKILPIGEYFDKVVEAATLHAKVYSLVTENVILVEAPDVKNANNDLTLNLFQFAVAINSSFALYPNAVGHTYIKDQLTNALDIENTKPMMGDVDLNGEISIFDVTEIQLAIASYFELTDVQFEVADVDYNGDVNIMDATKIQLYLAGSITEF